MQVVPTQNPIMSNALPQEAVVKTLPQVQAQASAPLTQRAVDPASQSDRGHKSRNNADRAKGGGKSGDGASDRGGSVNIRV